jgi:hypothetical protein
MAARGTRGDGEDRRRGIEVKVSVVRTHRTEATKDGPAERLLPFCQVDQGGVCQLHLNRFVPGHELCDPIERLRLDGEHLNHPGLKRREEPVEGRAMLTQEPGGFRHHRPAD